MSRTKHRIWRARCGVIGSGPLLPLAGEGGGEGVSASGLSRIAEIVLCCESPHPPRAGRCFASPGARRPLPQAGEAEQARAVLVKSICDSAATCGEGWGRGVSAIGSRRREPSHEQDKASHMARTVRRHWQWAPSPACGRGLGRGCLRVGIVENCGDCPCVVRALTRRARDDASHRPGRVGLSRKRERRSKPARSS